MARARPAPSRSTPSTYAGSAHSARCRSWSGRSTSTTASAVSFFNAPYEVYAPASFSGSPSVHAARISSRLATPGRSSGSYATSRPLSVTARMTFLRTVSGSSSR